MATVPREAMSDEQFNRLLQFFQVFSNESRLRLIGHLANGERSVGELAQLLGLKEPTVSHHLAELKGLGSVSYTHLDVYKRQTLSRMSSSDSSSVWSCWGCSSSGSGRSPSASAGVFSAGGC